MFLAPGVVTMALAALLLSAAGSMVRPAAGALLTDSVTADQRRAAFSLFHWAVNIGTAAAGILGGFLATHGYWMLFALDAAAVLTYAVIVVASPAGGAALPRPPAQEREGYGVVFRDPLLRVLLPLFGIGLFVYSLTEVACRWRSATAACRPRSA